MNLDFDKGNGLIPAIIQDSRTKNVLMLGYMNKQAYKKTQAEGKVTFYSRTKQRLWTKGETSGNFLSVIEMKKDCDNDTLLILVKPNGPVCHTGSDTCFDGTNESNAQFLHYLESVIHDRRINPKEGSYTNKLFEKGINKIAQKVGEEAVELIIEAKDDDNELFLNEAADLMFHYLVLLNEKAFELNDVIKILTQRHK